MVLQIKKPLKCCSFSDSKTVGFLTEPLSHQSFVKIKEKALNSSHLGSCGEAFLAATRSSPSDPFPRHGTDRRKAHGRLCKADCHLFQKRTLGHCRTLRRTARMSRTQHAEEQEAESAHVLLPSVEKNQDLRLFGFKPVQNSLVFLNAPTPFDIAETLYCLFLKHAFGIIVIFSVWVKPFRRLLSLLCAILESTRLHIMYLRSPRVHCTSRRKSFAYSSLHYRFSTPHGRVIHGNAVKKVPGRDFVHASVEPSSIQNVV